MKKLILFLIIFIYVLHEHGNISKAGSTEIKIDSRKASLGIFFKKFHSPWVGFEKDFIAISEKYNLDYRLLPSIGCVESSCGKFFTKNPFGWGNGNIECGTVLEDAECVAKGISTLDAYEVFRRSGNLYDFARRYNPKNKEKYFTQLKWFYRQF